MNKKFNYQISEEQFISELYNLILDTNTFETEREIYIKAKNLIEIEKEYYEAVIFNMVPTLAYIGRKNKLSKNGTSFLTKLSKFNTNTGLGFGLFSNIIEKDT